jgi:hypothetical protein
MRYTSSLFFASLAYGAVIPRQAPPPSGLPTPGDLVGGALEAAGAGVNGAAQGLQGAGPAADLPAGILGSIGTGLSSAGAAAKGGPLKIRQTVPDIGDIVGGALEAAGSAVNGAAQGLKGGNSPATDLPAGILGSVGSGLDAAGSAAKGPRVRRQAVGDVGGILGGALTSAGVALEKTGKEMEDSWLTTIPGSVLQSIGAGKLYFEYFETMGC